MQQSLKRIRIAEGRVGEMKKTWFCTAVLAAAAVFGSGCSAGSLPGMSGGVYKDADKYTMGNAKLPADGIESLDLDWLSGEIEIAYHAEDTIIISETSGKTLDEKTTMYYFVDGDTLRVKFAKSGKWNFRDLKKELQVWLPEGTELKKLEADTTSADVTIREIRAEKLTADTVSGDVLLDGAEVSESLQVDTTSGELTAKISGRTEEVSADTVSGDVSLELSEAGKLKLDSTSGRVNVSMDTPADSLSVDTVSGDVVLYLPENAGVTVSWDTVSGSFRSELDTKTDGDDYRLGDGKKKYSVDTVSGNLKLEKREQ